MYRFCNRTTLLKKILCRALEVNIGPFIITLDPNKQEEHIGAITYDLYI